MVLRILASLAGRDAVLRGSYMELINDNFSTLSQIFVTLFLTTTLDGASEIYAPLLRENHDVGVWIFYICFLFIVSIAFMNLVPLGLGIGLGGGESLQLLEARYGRCQRHVRVRAGTQRPGA